MNNKFLSLAFLLLTPVAVFGQSSASTSANVSVNIYGAISITKSSDLVFGDVVAGSGAGTVTVDAQNPSNNAVTGTGYSVSSSAPQTRAAFSVAGSPSANYVIQLPASITLSGPGTAMTVNAFKVSTVTGGVNGTDQTSGYAGTLSASGSQVFDVGATLGVGAGQTVGAYTGTFNVTVSYD